VLTETFHSIITAARNVFRNWQSTLLIASIYAALLALLYLEGRAGNVPTATGARGYRVLGALTPGVMGEVVKW